MYASMASALPAHKLDKNDRFNDLKEGESKVKSTHEIFARIDFFGKIRIDLR